MIKKSYLYLCVLYYIAFLLAPAYAAVITPYEVQDLQLLKTYQDKPGLLSKIDYTQTAIGSAYLQEQLLNPLTNITHLKERQDQVQLLLNNPHLCNALTQQLAIFAQYQKGIAFFANADSIIGSAIINSYYFQNRFFTWLNKYPAGLELGQVLHVANLFAPLIEHAVIHFLVSEKLHDYLGMCCHQGHTHCHDHSHHHHNPPSTGAVIAYQTYNIAHTLIHLMGLKGLVDLVSEQAQVIRAMQTELMRVARCLETAHTILQAVQEYPTFFNNTHDFQELASLFDTKKSNCSPELQEFLALMRTSTFKGNPSIFSRPGNILRAYALAKVVYPELKQKLSAIAIIDFYLSIAHLYQVQKSSWCFAHYDDQLPAHIAMQGFWNPLLASMQPIHQTIALGSSESRVAIITGPNKAGKSTNLSALAISILLAQTIGIAPATSCTITPFTTITTGFNMNNRVTDGQSLFSTSLAFAQEILTQLSKPNARIFIAVDELFNSTEYTQGSLIAQRFAQALGGNTRNNCIALIATHFSNLTQLEKEDPKVYKNYKAELLTTRGSCEYILEPGVSDASNALHLMENNQLLN